MTAAGTSALPSSSDLPSWRAASHRVIGALVLVVLPGALAIAVVRYFVPAVGAGFPGVVSSLGHRYPLPFGVALFVVFSGLAHYWRAYLPVVARPANTAAIARKSRPLWETASLVLLIAVAAGAAVAVRSMARPYRVLSASMVPTLEPDDLVFGRMHPYGGALGPRRGDIVVFRGSAVVDVTGALRLPDTVVKRVIGLPGDRISMRGGTPVINGWPVPSCDAGEYLYVVPDTTGRGVHGRLRVEFLEDRAYLAVYAMGLPFEDTYAVTPGEIFVLGDNRGNSVDSRAYNGGHGGGVPLNAVDARTASFLAGTQPSGRADLGRFLRPLDDLEVREPLPSMAADLRQGVARCLANRPKDTTPPAP